MSSRQSCLETLPGALRVYSLFGIVHGKLITTTLSSSSRFLSTLPFVSPQISYAKRIYGRYTDYICQNCEAGRNATHDRSIKKPMPRPTPCECLDYPALLLTFQSISTDIQSPFSFPD